MKLHAEHIQELVEEILPDNDVFIVEVKVSEKSVLPKITIIADSENGISIDQCARISRRLNKKMEEIFGEEFAYSLEVTSPGIDQPLTLPKQFKKNIGRKIKLILSGGTEKTGTIEEVLENGILLKEEIKEKGKKLTTNTVHVDFSEIAKAQIVISFK